MFKLPDRIPGRPLFQPDYSGDEDREHDRSIHSRLWTWSMLAFLTGAVILSGELLLDVIMDIAELVFDFVEETLENFYRKSGKMDLRHAQMATAYTYLGFAFFVALMTGRRIAQWMIKQIRQGMEMANTRKERVRATYRSYSIYFGTWWETLDWLSRAAVLVGIGMGAIPFFLILSFGLGMAVAELF